MAVFQVWTQGRLRIACKQFPQLVFPAFPSSPGGQDGVTGWYGVQRSGARGAALAAPTAHCPLPSRSVFFFDITCRMSSTTAQQLGTATARVVQQVEAAAQRLALCRRAFSESLTEAAALNDAQTRLYRMDVGGALFHSHTEVLHRHGGMLSAMASSDFSHDMEGGDYAFIDRDPAWFPLVLHVMQTGAALLPDDTEGRAAVRREAQYYSLEGLCRAAIAQDRIVIIRFDIDTRQYSCEMYNPFQGAWERMDVSMGVLTEHRRVGLCAGDRCLFAVAYPTAQCPGSVSRFRPAAGSWELIASTVPDQHSIWGYEMYYHSGHLYGTVENHVHSLNVSTGQWEELPPLSTTREFATLCVVDTRLFVIGGGIAGVEEYVPLERRWVSVPDMPRSVESAAAVALEGKLLVIGGVHWDMNGDIVVLSAVIEYDPKDGSWKELPSMLTARYSCAVAVLGGDVVVLVVGRCRKS